MLVKHVRSRASARLEPASLVCEKPHACNGQLGWRGTMILIIVLLTESHYLHSVKLGFLCLQATFPRNDTLVLSGVTTAVLYNAAGLPISHTPYTFHLYFSHGDKHRCLLPIFVQEGDPFRCN